MLLHSLDPGLPQLPLCGEKACCPGSSPPLWAKALVAVVSKGCLSAGQTEIAPESKRKSSEQSDNSITWAIKL